MYIANVTILVSSLVVNDWYIVLRVDDANA